MAETDYSKLTAEDLASPSSSDVTLRGTDSDEHGGAKKLGGSPLMLDIRPLHGYGKLLHYSRIEDIDYSSDNTQIIISAATYSVNIKGRNLLGVRQGLQYARIVSLEVGKNPNADDAEIQSIHITHYSDNEEG